MYSHFVQKLNPLPMFLIELVRLSQTRSVTSPWKVLHIQKRISMLIFSLSHALFNILLLNLLLYCLLFLATLNTAALKHSDKVHFQQDMGCA